MVENIGRCLVSCSASWTPSSSLSALRRSTHSPSNTQASNGLWPAVMGSISLLVSFAPLHIPWYRHRLSADPCITQFQPPFTSKTGGRALYCLYYSLAECTVHVWTYSEGLSARIVCRYEARRSKGLFFILSYAACPNAPGTNYYPTVGVNNSVLLHLLWWWWEL